MGIVLFVLGMLMGVETILTPERLTPLVEKMATRSLQNCEVNIDRVELKAVTTFPFVHAKVDNLVIVSTVRQGLDEGTRSALPEYTDTVLSVRRFEGGLNLIKVFSNELELSDVTITHPSANLVVIDEETTNFDIIPERKDKEKPFDWKDLPVISLKRFEIVDPGDVRFYNFETDTELKATLSEASLDGSASPYYSLHFDGNVDMGEDFMAIFNLPDLRFKLNGSLKWSQQEPTRLALNDFDVRFSIFGFKVNTDIDFSNGILFNTLQADFLPLDVTQILSILPEEIARELGIPTESDVNTNAVVDMSLCFDRPWLASSDVVSPFTLTAEVPRCRFDGYGISASDFAAKATVQLLSPWNMSEGAPDMTVTLDIPETDVAYKDVSLQGLTAQAVVTLPKNEDEQADVDVRRFHVRNIEGNGLNIKDLDADIDVALGETPDDEDEMRPIDLSVKIAPVNIATNEISLTNVRADLKLHLDSYNPQMAIAVKVPYGKISSSKISFNGLTANALIGLPTEERDVADIDVRYLHLDRFDGYDLAINNFTADVDVSLGQTPDDGNGSRPMAAKIRVPSVGVIYKGTEFASFDADAILHVPSGGFVNAYLDINSARMKSEAVTLTIKGRLSNIVNDPTFHGNFDTHTDISKLPYDLLKLAKGSLSGLLSANLEVRGSQSMLSPQNFHKIYLKGDVSLDNVYWISADTLNMIDLQHALVHLDTQQNVADPTKAGIDSLMRIDLKVDTALILHSDISMNLSNLEMNLSAKDTYNSTTNVRVAPLGGSIALKAFNMLKTNDSTVVRMRDMTGSMLVEAYRNDISKPQFTFDLDLNHVAAGKKATRMLVDRAHTHLVARKLSEAPKKPNARVAPYSPRQMYPQMPPDSVIRYALMIHNRRPRSPFPRVHEVYESKDQADIIDWGASPMFKVFLNDWTFKGNLTSDRGALFTPYIPVRNRMRGIDVSFNNDTVRINNLQYKMGHCDFTVNGVVTNMRKAFSTDVASEPLRVNFEVLSDTLDVNQITETMVAMSTLMQSKTVSPLHEKRLSAALDDVSSIEESTNLIEKHLAMLTANAPDTLMPLLIPENMDAQFTVKANNLRYSDFEFKDMSGRILAYGGALSLENIKARSVVGDIDLSALYTGLHPDELRFGFDLKVSDFHLHRFLKLVPAVDSLIPVMRDFRGTIGADVVATTDLDNRMNLVLPSLNAAIKIKGDSLELTTPEKLNWLAKWIVFDDKKRSFIDEISVQMTVQDEQINIFPFVFSFDHYKLGVLGYNDFDMNFNYHIAVLKSPIPFKFGINIAGNPDKFHVKLGGAKFGDQQMRQIAIVDTTRINLMNEINKVFRRGARDARLAHLKFADKPYAASIDLEVGALTHSDSLKFIREGLIEVPEATPTKSQMPATRKEDKSRDTSLQLWLPFIVLPAVLTTNSSSVRRRKNDRKNSA